MMRIYCISRYICFLLAFCLILIFTAKSGFSAGKITIQPFIELKTQMDSNFYKSETKAKSVNTNIINPGIVIKYYTGKSMIGLDYNAKLKWEDGDSDDEHNAGVLFQTQATNLMQFSLNNRLMKTRDPASADSNANSVDRYNYYINTFSPELNYQLSEKFNLKAKYTNKITNYIEDGTGQGEDAQENRFGLTFYYMMNPKTTLDLDYQYWVMDYGKTSVDYTSNQIMSNVNYKFNQLTLLAGAGYHSRSFDKSIPSGDLGRVSWKMGVSGQSDSEDGDTPKSSIYVSLSQNYNDSGQGDTYFISTGINANFTYLFTNKITGKLSGYFKNADYETSTRKDDRWAITPSVDYLLNDKFTVGLETGYEERSSNMAGKSFDNEYGMVKLRYKYDLGAK
jgi:hypothetical protein